ncbi:MAG: cohesin domain-containing protein [Candidatus Shapirobacteria bacterium]
MKLGLKIFSALIFLFFLSLARPAWALAGPRFYLDPASGSYSVSEDFTVSVKIDPAGNDIVSIDAILNFDADKLKVTDVQAESYFVGPLGNQQGFNYILDNDAGEIQLYSFMRETNSTINTAGAIAKIYFEAKEEGTASVTFVCSSNIEGDSSIWTAEGEDLIDCDSVGSGSYTISDGGDMPDPTNAPVPTATSAPVDDDTPVPTSTPAGTGGESATNTPTSAQLMDSGIVEPLVVAVFLGSVFIALGFLGLIW